MSALHRILWPWAKSMAQHYAQEIPDYARLDRAFLERDVAMASYEFLRALFEGEHGEEVEAVALAVGQRRQQQGSPYPPCSEPTAFGLGTRSKPCASNTLSAFPCLLPGWGRSWTG